MSEGARRGYPSPGQLPLGHSPALLGTSLRGCESSSHLLPCSPSAPVPTSPSNSEHDRSGTPLLGAGLGLAEGQESRVSLYPTFRGEEKAPEGQRSHSLLLWKLLLPGWEPQGPVA